MNVSFKDIKSILKVYHATNIVMYTEKEALNMTKESTSHETYKHEKILQKYKETLEITNIIIDISLISVDIIEYVNTCSDKNIRDIIYKIEESILKLRSLLLYRYRYITYRVIVTCILCLYNTLMNLTVSEEHR